MDSDQELRSRKVFELTPAAQQLPESYSSRRSSFYHRECYEEYYQYIYKGLKEDHRIITLTGMPGIGKSVFYV